MPATLDWRDSRACSAWRSARRSSALRCLRPPRSPRARFCGWLSSTEVSSSGLVVDSPLGAALRLFCPSRVLLAGRCASPSSVLRRLAVCAAAFSDCSDLSAPCFVPRLSRCSPACFAERCASVAVVSASSVAALLFSLDASLVASLCEDLAPSAPCSVSARVLSLVEAGCVC